MAQPTDSSLSNPGGRSKIQDGRVEKPKTKRTESKNPNYSIDGRTFACESCKRGHRVSKCTHALQRPVHMTNDPGRPSADQKRHCDCPKQCSCTKKNCKCDRNCNCTQKMFMLVYVPLDLLKDAVKGEYRIDREVITDLKGNILSEAEIKERASLKTLQKTDKSAAISSATFRSNDNSSPATSNGATPIPSSSGSCCGHKRDVEDKARLPAKSVAQPQTERSRPQCNCGSSCTCAFCLDHPNNNTSQGIAKQQAAHFAGQGRFESTSWITQDFTPSQMNMSCMGTNPQFAMLNNPYPSSEELQDIFGANSGQGYVLSYPITGPSSFFPSSPYSAAQAPFPELPTPSLADQQPTLATSGFSIASSNNLNAPPQQSGELSLQSDPSSWDIGDASVSNLSSYFGNRPPSMTQWPISGDTQDLWSFSGVPERPSVNPGQSLKIGWPGQHSQSELGFPELMQDPSLTTASQLATSFPDSTINFDDFLEQAPQPPFEIAPMHQKSSCCQPEQNHDLFDAVPNYHSPHLPSSHSPPIR